MISLCAISGVFRGGVPATVPPPRSGIFFPLWVVAEPPVKTLLRGGGGLCDRPVWRDYSGAFGGGVTVRWLGSREERKNE
jgi:hypothetical protein